NSLTLRSHCFLSDVRSEVKSFGLVKIQDKLLDQILKTKDVKVGSVVEGINLIKARWAIMIYYDIAITFEREIRRRMEIQVQKTKRNSSL
ncbi:hypothetical protein H5410_047876, partial [Solanum commersonii]